MVITYHMLSHQYLIFLLHRLPPLLNCQACQDSFIHDIYEYFAETANVLIILNYFPTCYDLEKIFDGTFYTTIFLLECANNNKVEIHDKTMTCKQ